MIEGNGETCILELYFPPIPPCASHDFLAPDPFFHSEYVCTLVVRIVGPVASL